jgi:hypothetical protein
MPRFWTALAIVVGGAALTGCGNKTTVPDSALTGSYTAFEWVQTGSSGSTNMLLAGATLQITLNANQTTSGLMHLPAANGTPAMDFDMVGTWSTNGYTVDISQNADTFVRNMTFHIQPIGTGVWDLVGGQNFSGTRVEITLRHG